MHTPPAKPTPTASLTTPVALWGLIGVSLLLLNAIVRLSPRAAAPFVRMDLTAFQWVVLAGTVGFFAYAEGYKGFHLRFSPRCVRRAAELSSTPWWAQVLAPATCMGLIWATRRRMIGSWALVTMIVSFIVALQYVPYPWREIVDAGVVVGLGAGMASLGVILVRALAGTMPEVDPQWPTA